MMGGILDRASELRDDFEATRIELHLKQTEEVLRSQEAEDCVDEKRTETLNHLNYYRNRAQFPANPDFNARRPYFVGPNGSLCAVGYLLHKNGRDDVVESIKQNNNHVYLEDFEASKTIKWEKELGLSKEECERIQPTYGPYFNFAQTCGPVGCRIALAILLLISAGILLKLEKFTHAYLNRLYPQKPLKRRSTFTGISIINIVIVANLFVLLFAILP